MPAQVLSGPASENSTHPLRQLEVCDLPRIVVLDEGLVLAQVDLISSLCDFGNAQERTLHWANFPDNPAALSSVRPITDLLPRARMGSPPRASEDLARL